jgi:DNA polymerase-1
MSAWLEDPSVSDEKKFTIQSILDYQLANKIKASYLETALKGSVEISEGDYRIFADFNQTSTITGRLSSSGTWNLQTIPSGSKYGKVVKELLIAPEGFIMATADYSALEDVLMANESRDKNKLAIFEKGIDGHCLNAYAYFKDECKARGYEYDIEDPSSINKLKKECPDLRQDSKPYTFGFSYGAGPEKYGEDIYNAYWETYAGVKVYNDAIIAKAKKQGYLVSKFSGLRLNLPAINARAEFDQTKEARVAVNFSIQSGNFLMLKAINNLQKWIEEEGLDDDVVIVNTVHDSVILYIREDANLIEKVNKALIKFMVNRYSNDQILNLSAELDIGRNYASMITLKNNEEAYKINEVLYELTDTDF